ncbi:MAG: hypothetical protein WC466_10265 [Candidatus Izemoplasmatales bacterium]
MPTRFFSKEEEWGKSVSFVLVGKQWYHIDTFPNQIYVVTVVTSDELFIDY